MCTVAAQARKSIHEKKKSYLKKFSLGLLDQSQCQATYNIPEMKPDDSDLIVKFFLVLQLFF